MSLKSALPRSRAVSPRWLCLRRSCHQLHHPALAQNGGHIVAQKTIYGGTSNLLEHTLPAFGVKTTFVDAHNLAEVEGSIQENTRAVYLETLGNPNSDIPDIDAIAEIAHKHGIPLVIDTPSARRT